MILKLCNGTQIRGDMIKVATLRSDLAPIPETLEAEIRIDDELKPHLVQGGKIKVSGNETPHRIIKVEDITQRAAQSHRHYGLVRITTLIDNVHALSFVRKPGSSVIMECVSLTCCYKACGATIGAIKNAPPVPRFTCMVGDTPTFHIARILQENGGSIRARCGSLEFMRFQDMACQKERVTISDAIEDTMSSGFLERHEVPWFFSMKENAGHEMGKTCKARSVRFAPIRKACTLNNMSTTLILEKSVRIDHNEQIYAGDAVKLPDGRKLVVMTAAHTFNSGTDGSHNNQYTRLWLGALA